MPTVAKHVGGKETPPAGRHIVFTDFADEITGVNEDGIIEIPSMTGVEYQRKVEQYLQSHLNNIVIERLRTNRPLSPSDLQELENMLVAIGAGKFAATY